MSFPKGHKGFRTKESFRRTGKLVAARPNAIANQFKKGTIPWNKGKPLAPETKAKMSAKLKGRSVWNKGKKFSEESRKRMSLAKSGPNHPKWRGGISKLPSYKRKMREKYLGRKYEVGGSHTRAEWETLKAQYNWTCPCCKKVEPQVKLTADHIVPITKGGSDNIENIQPLCGSCNSRKHTKIIKYEK